MPKFHFPIVDGTKLDDPVGVLKNKSQAKLHADAIAQFVVLISASSERTVVVIKEDGN
jgi:hypothetical protein